MTTRSLLPLLAFLLALATPGASQTAYTWNGSNGDWFTPGNWSPSGVPGAVDTARVASGNPVLSRDTTAARVEFGGASLDGDGHLTVTDTFVWSGGDLDGRDFAETAALTIAPGAVLLITGDAEKGLRGRDVFNDGTIVWEGTGDLVVRWSTVLENRAGATFDIRGDLVLTRSNGTLDLLNDGLLVKSAGSGTTGIFYPFGRLDNEGTIRVETGTLTFSNATSSFSADGDGAFEVAAGATLRFNQAEHTYGPGSTLTCDGVLLVTGGTVEIGTAGFTGAAPLVVSGGTAAFGSATVPGLTTIDGGALRFDDPDIPSELGAVALSAGELGGTGVKNVNGLLTWTGGRLGTRFDQEGVLNLLGGVEASGPETKLFGGGTYNNPGLFRWMEGNLEINTGGLFNNAVGATLSIENDGEWLRSNGTLTMINEGLIVKSGTEGQTFVNLPFAPFNNDGEIRVETGSLFLNIGGVGSSSTDTGAYVIEQDAQLRFDNHTRTFTPESSMRGTGTVRFTGGEIRFSGTLRPGGSSGVLAVDSDWPALEPDGVLELEIGGLAAGTEHDVLAVTGTASLGGIVRPLFIDGFEPEVGDRFTVVTAGGVEGTFAAVEAPDGIEMAAEALADRVDLVVTAVTVPNEPGADEGALPAVFALGTAYPNPTAATATVPYDVPASARVRLALYDVLGREVAVLVDAERPTGRYEAVLDARALAAGTYLVRMTAPGGFTRTRRVTLMR